MYLTSINYTLSYPGQGSEGLEPIQADNGWNPEQGARPEIRPWSNSKPI